MWLETPPLFPPRNNHGQWRDLGGSMMAKTKTNDFTVVHEPERSGPIFFWSIGSEKRAVDVFETLVRDAYLREDRFESPKDRLETLVREFRSDFRSPRVKSKARGVWAIRGYRSGHNDWTGHLRF